ncbi:hypothetical protein NE237_018406 [Protea cynaroides]|uniref:BHLH domain-containing protein n=1 Tax=Protea cynaroides TaxID=273540 RepID=A0A9Q0K9W6_9MAGN|nr:hypothetical protein NE237_018406 [Protea cynaroides]
MRCMISFIAFQPMSKEEIEKVFQFINKKISMESANLNLHHHHQLQEQLIGSSSLATPSFYGVGTTRSGNSNLSLPDGNFNQYVSDSRQNNSSLDPLLNASMVQELGFTAGSFTNHSANNHLQLSKIKEELSDSLPKFTETVNNPFSLEEFYLPSTRYIKDNEQQDLHELGGKILFKTLSSVGQSINGPQLSAGDIYSNAQNRVSFGGNLNQIYPTRNILDLNPFPSTFSSCLGMNLQPLDLLSSMKFGGSTLNQLSQNNIGLSKERFSCSSDHLQIYSNMPSFRNGDAEKKRPSNFAEAKASYQGSTSKKVRKEKLGDRIATLQQLVAPFGKTDTASVLMEAIGYIKFLQEQVETLSVPYLKSSRNKNSRTLQEGSSQKENEEQKRDLRSWGLCLVPLSCTSYVTNNINEVFWPPPNFS